MSSFKKSRSRVLFLVIVKKEVKRGMAEKAFLDRDIASIEPMVESLWQFWIMGSFLCWVLDAIIVAAIKFLVGSIFSRIPVYSKPTKPKKTWKP